MFTSRAEFRILLRQDNADLRLTDIGYNLGLADKERLEAVNNKRTDLKHLLNDLNQKKVTPKEVNDTLTNLNSASLKEKQSLSQLIKRPELSINKVKELTSVTNQYLEKYNDLVLEQAEIQIKYDHYINKEKQMAEKMKNIETHRIPTAFDYDKLSALSAEGREKLKKISPETIGQASRISGVSPSDISILMVYLGK